MKETKGENFRKKIGKSFYQIIPLRSRIAPIKNADPRDKKVRIPILDPVPDPRLWLDLFISMGVVPTATPIVVDPERFRTDSDPFLWIRILFSIGFYLTRI